MALVATNLNNSWTEVALTRYHTYQAKYVECVEKAILFGPGINAIEDDP